MLLHVHSVVTEERWLKVKANMKTETSAKLRYLRTSPRKVRLLIDLIRGSHVNDAIAQLEVSKKHVSQAVLKLLKSAIANAVHNDNVDPSTLVVKTAYVDGGPILYRWMPRAFGRATKIRKRTSHVTIVLEGDVKEAPKKENKKKAEKAEKTETVEETATTKEVKEKKVEKTKATKKPAAKKAPAKKAAAKKTAKK